MPGVCVTVTLVEALEVRGAPLEEEQVWAVICQTAEALQDLFLLGGAMMSEQPALAVTPDTIQIGRAGRISIAPSPLTTILSPDLLPPEYQPTARITEEAVEKMYVFGLGVSVYSALDFQQPDNQELPISGRLDALLSAMCEEDPGLRINLVQVLQACAEQYTSVTHRLPSSHIVARLHKLVLGSTLELPALVRDNPRPSRGHHQPNKYTNWHQTNSPRSRSRSRSKSRSRSRSRSRDRHYFHKERPHPVGRDHNSDFPDGHSSRSHPSNKSYDSSKGFPYHHPYPVPSYGTDIPVYSQFGFQPSSAPHRPTSHKQHAGPARTQADEDRINHIRDPVMRKTYERLKERQRKLEALRHGLETDDLDPSDLMSLHSEITDFGERRSMISANSYTRGVFQPGLLQQYGSQLGLQLGREGDDAQSLLSDESTWLHRQRQETAARKLAQTTFAEPRPMGDGGRSNTATPTSGRPPPPPRRGARSQPVSRAMSPNSARSPSAGRTPNTGPREFYGPEFMQHHETINLQLPESRNSQPASLRHVTVILLNNQRLDVVCDFNNTSQELYDCVAAHLILAEHFFFSLAVLHETEYYFLETDTALHKAAPKAWRDAGKARAPATFTTYLRVKFYPNSLGALRHAATRHLMYLQLRRDLMEERCGCSDDRTLPLVGLALQAEYGDLSSTTPVPAPDHYLPSLLTRRMGTAYVRDRLPNLHAEHTGMSNRQAENLFIKDMMQLPEYGIHFYRVLRSKKDLQTPAWLGVSMQGLLLAERTAGSRIILQRHGWQFTQKISFNRRRFSVSPKTEAGLSKVSKMNYYTDSYRKSRYLVQFCTDNHRFQMMMQLRAEPEADEMLDEDFNVDADMQSLPPGAIEPLEVEESFDGGNYGDQYAEEEGSALHSPPRASTPSSHHQSRPHSRHQRSREDLRSPPRGHSSAVSTPRSPPPIGSPLPDYDPLDLSQGPERRILVVELEKNAMHGLGITIVGGDNMGKLDLGVFVKSVTPGGPADIDGRIQVGDRIIAINGQSLEGTPHHVAVELMRESAARVQIMLSQAALPTLGALSRSSTPSLDHTTVERNMIVAPTARRTRTPVDVHRSLQEAVSPGRVPQPPSSIGSSDLELEDMLPSELQLNPSSSRPEPQNWQQSPDGYVSDEELDEAAQRAGISNSSNRRGDGASSAGVESPRSLTAGVPHGRSVSASLTHLRPGDKYEVLLEKRNGSLGLNVTGGVNTSVKHGGIYVKSLTTRGSAEMDSRIHVGDRVLEINSVRLIGVTHRQAVETLRSAPEKCCLVMERGVPPTPRHHRDLTSPTLSPESSSTGALNDDLKVGSSDPTSPITTETHTPMDVSYYPFVNNDNTWEVALRKNSTGLGLSVVGGARDDPDPMHCVTRIRKIFPTGPASQVTDLQVGDMILEVNETGIKDLTQQEVMMLLRTVAPDVKLLVCRPPAGVLPSIPQLLDGIDTPKSPAGTPVDEIGNTSASQSEHPHRSQSDDSPSQTIQSQQTDGEGDDTSTPEEEEAAEPDIRGGTPSPVTDFLHDAGLTDSESSPPTRDTVGGESDDGQDTQPLKAGEFDVELTKGDKGLGFTVAGGQNTTGFFFIKDVLYDPAKAAGCLRPGDRLIMVNGWDMTGMTHQEAVSFLRDTPATVTLRFHRAPNPSTPTQQVTTPSLTPQSTSPREKDFTPANHRLFEGTPTSKGDRVTSPDSSFGNMSLPISEGRQSGLVTPSHELMPGTENGALKVELRRAGDQSLGFSLVQGEKGAVCALYVKSLAPGGLAAIDGRMMVGDRLLQVNGESVIGMPHNKAVALIKKANSSITITLSRSGQPPSTRTTPRNTPRSTPRNTPRNTPLHEIDQNSAEYIEPQSQQESYDTDSDVDSTTFDEEQEQREKSHDHNIRSRDQNNRSRNHSPKSHESSRAHQSAAQSDDEDPRTFDSLEGEEALNRFVRGKEHAGGDETEEDEDDSWAEETRALQEEEMLKEMAASRQIPVKPPRRNHLSRLPAEISQSWLDLLDLVSPTPDTVHYSGAELAATCRTLQAQIDSNKPNQEYKNLKHAKLTDNCLMARREENKSKNRFRNVLPYDANRVKLAGDDDYINASHVRYSCGRKQLHYIACQGPLPQTAGDFWKMVWEQRVEVIAMVTKDVEEGKVKCHLYWPDALGAPFTVCNRYEVSLSQVHTLPHFKVHHIKMEDLETGHTHRVTHLNFTGWPDHGTPVSGTSILQYIRFLHLVHDSGPIVVHCSAGIGRTGVLLTLDIILTHIQADLKFDVKQLVQKLRRQRQGLIQTTDQYNFCYHAVLDALQTLS